MFLDLRNALLAAGINRPARMAMIDITIRSSTRVKQMTVDELQFAILKQKTPANWQAGISGDVIFSRLSIMSDISLYYISKKGAKGKSEGIFPFTRGANQLLNWGGN
jgi:hypothetical protein